MIDQIPPGLILVLGALLVPALPWRALRQLLMLALPIATGIHCLLIPLGTEISITVFEYELQLVRVDALARVFTVIFSVAALLSVIYSLHVKDRVQHLAALMYAGSAIGAVHAGDLITLFLFWEGTAITSVFLIWVRKRPWLLGDAAEEAGERAYRTGLRYLIVQVASGVLLLAGAIIVFHNTGSLAFGTDATPFGAFAFEHLCDAKPGVLLILLAFGIKAAFPLLHSWLPDAYPEGSVTGTVWLSAFTTKLAIYALARGFAGTEMLIPLGIVMATVPLIYASMENDLRRVLAWCLNNQLGFMVVGIGIGTPLALNGVAAHAFAHILYKSLLFMGVGAVLYRTGTSKGSELGGLWRSMPSTAIFTTVAALGISAPLFAGFISKSMIISAAAEQHLTWVFVILMLASAAVFHQSGVRIVHSAFFGPRAEPAIERAGLRKLPFNMTLAMGIGAALIIAVGSFPAWLYDRLPHDMHNLHYVAYDMSHVVTVLQLLAAATLAYFVGVRLTERRATNLDFDWTYRRLGKAVVLDGGGAAWGVWQGLLGRVKALVLAVVAKLRWWTSPAGRMGEPWPIGEAALWAAGILVAFLVLAYL
jgi:multicomponent Na+:H+ antiporter subunit D